MGDGAGIGVGWSSWSLFLSSGGEALVVAPSTGELATSVPPTLRVNWGSWLYLSSWDTDRLAV